MASSSSLLLDIGQGLSLMLGLPRLATWKTKERPDKPKRGTFGFNSQTGSLEYYDGEAWFAAPLAKA